MEIAAEVPALEGKIGRNKDFGPSSGAENSAVVANAKGYRSTSRGAEVAANLLDQG
jgi:hypothetical protein